jgi:NAD(P)-dependent dehydrogenase (short-subunit alcohol dehydrogenase family)
MSMRFVNKVVLIIGGNSGIGRSAAQAYAEEGAQVVITGRDPKTLAEAQAAIGPAALAIRSDVADLASLDQVMQQVRHRHGRIDVLFVNAGIGTFAPIPEVTPELWDEVHAVNLRGCFFAAQKALPLMGHGGSIVFTGSIGSRLDAHLRGGARGQGHPREHGEPGPHRDAAHQSQPWHGRQRRGCAAPDDDRQHTHAPHGRACRDRARGAVPQFRRGQLHHRRGPVRRWRGH